MQGFKKNERMKIKKREANERVADFKEIYQILNANEAEIQAERCVQCGNPFCHNACPLHNFIPIWLLNVAKKDFSRAFYLSNFTNPFPEITGRVCPQDRLCEGACTLHDDFGAITIGAVETFITEKGFDSGLLPKFSEKKLGKKVAIIGAGPAGLSAANFLLKAGIDVEIFDENSRGGGLLSYGIPGFKIEKSVVENRIKILTNAGAKFHFGKKVGSKSLKLNKLINDYDALFLGFGAKISKEANISGEKSKGCFMAIDFLTQIQKEQNRESSEILDISGKKVIVIGGGDTAMDCLRSALRKGASEAICLYRRGKAEMPGSKKEFLNASEEGANFIFNSGVKEVITNENGEVLGVKTFKTIVNNGKVEAAKGNDGKVDGDIVIFALGFEVAKEAFLAENGIETDKFGRILVDENFSTTCSGVFAGGDCVRGPNLVVSAAADGKNAAEAIVKFLS